MISPTVIAEVRLNRTRVHCIVCSHLPIPSGPIWPAATVTFTTGGEFTASWAYCLGHVDSVDNGVELINNSAELTLIRVDDHRTPDERLRYVDGVGTVLLPSLDRLAS